MIRPMPFWPSLEPCAKLTPVQVRISRLRIHSGGAFGPSGAGHVRMCYATSYEKLEEALARIGRFVGRHRS